MTDIAKLLREAAWHLRATSGVDYYPLAVTLDAAAAELDKAGPTDSELREMWRLAGGAFHGPRVETGTMPEEKLLPFLRNLRHPPSAGVPDGWDWHRYSYQTIFNAIAAATSIQGDDIAISVASFNAAMATAAGDWTKHDRRGGDA